MLSEACPQAAEGWLAHDVDHLGLLGSDPEEHSTLIVLEVTADEDGVVAAVLALDLEDHAGTVEAGAAI